jgi:branched-chain amino acid transport system substrate-binding protein
MNRILLILFAIILLLNQKSFTQVDEKQGKINSEFNVAVNLFEKGQYEDAAVIFNRIVSLYESNAKTTASVFFLCKIEFEEANYFYSLSLTNKFLKDFPDTKYADEAQFLIANIFLKQEKYEESFRALLQLIEQTASSSNYAEAKKIAEQITINYFNSYQVKKITDELTSSKLKPFLLLLLAKAYQKENDTINSIRAVSEIITKYPTAEERAAAENLKGSDLNIGNSGEGTVVAVLLPLSEISDPLNKSAGDEILDGIKFAFSEFNKNRKDKIGLLVKASSTDGQKISEIKEELINNESVKCILGPIFSDEVRMTLEAFKDTDIPIISPTATDADLTMISDNFFQANPPIAERGRMLAQYLYYVEDKHRMAVFNSIDNYSPLLAASFITEFENLGGEIVMRETYRKDNYDFSSQIAKIFSVAKQIEGIYVPLSDKSDASILLSQLYSGGIDLPIYGNQDWYLVKDIESVSSLSNKLTFTSDYFIDFQDSSFDLFSKSFSALTGYQPGRNVLYGYDTGKYILTILRNINNSRSNIKMKMISGVISNGYHNNISFDSKRINKYINIVRFRDGIFELVDKFRSD